MALTHCTLNSLKKQNNLDIVCVEMMRWYTENNTVTVPNDELIVFKHLRHAL